MNYIEFQRKYKDKPVILSRDVVRQAKDPQAMRNQLGRWQARKLLLKLKRGVYIFAAEEKPDVHWIANSLYEPSYLSLEYALSFYGLIPERVVDVTSITTLKTMHFKNELGHFVYRHVKPEVFRGFKKMGDNKLSFFMAEPEKAVVDFLYFKLPVLKKQTEIVLRESYRFQDYEDLDQKKLKMWAKLFGNAKLDRVTGEFCRMIKQDSA